MKDKSVSHLVFDMRIKPERRVMSNFGENLVSGVRSLMNVQLMPFPSAEAIVAGNWMTCWSGSM